jgi:hypothetical protein
MNQTFFYSLRLFACQGDLHQICAPTHAKTTCVGIPLFHPFRHGTHDFVQRDKLPQWRDVAAPDNTYAPPEEAGVGAFAFFTE